MTKKVDTILDKTTAIIQFWQKIYRIKRLKLWTILKIVDILKEVGAELAKKVEKWWDANDIVLILSSLKEESIYELICLILNNWICDEEKLKEIEENFNMADFIKLVRIVLEFEDIQTLFLEIKRMLEIANEAQQK